MEPVNGIVYDSIEGGYWQAPYVNGLLNGLWERWDENNTLVESINFNNGIMHGEFKRWYTDGQLMYNTLFTEGTGISQKYWSNRKILYVKEYLNGRLIAAQCWNKEGNEVDCE